MADLAVAALAADQDPEDLAVGQDPAASVDIITTITIIDHTDLATSLSSDSVDLISDTTTGAVVSVE